MQYLSVVESVEASRSEELPEPAPRRCVGKRFHALRTDQNVPAGANCIFVSLAALSNGCRLAALVVVTLIIVRLQQLETRRCTESPIPLNRYAYTAVCLDDCGVAVSLFFLVSAIFCESIDGGGLRRKRCCRWVPRC